MEAEKTAAEAEYGYDCTAPDTPALISPSNGQSFTTTSVTLDWETCYDTQYGSGMKHYVVYFSDNKGGSTSWTTSVSEDTVYSLSYSTTYYWQVRAVDNAGIAEAVVGGHPTCQERLFNLEDSYIPG